MTTAAGRGGAGVRLLPIAVAAATAALAILAAGTPSGDALARGGDENRNVLVVMTDDQRVEDMKAMPRTRRRIGQRGVSFANSFASFPVCCPSRATYLTGQYAHNHGVVSNHAPNGGPRLWTTPRRPRSRWTPRAIAPAGSAST